MEKKLIESIISDNKTIRLKEWNGQYFIFEPDNLIIGFFFMHRGYPKNSFSEPERRIILTVFFHDNLNVDIPFKVIEDTTRIMVNSDHLDYAFTFLLTVDRTNRKVKVKISDLPFLGQRIITNAEKEGIEIEY